MISRIGQFVSLNHGLIAQFSAFLCVLSAGFSFGLSLRMIFPARRRRARRFGTLAPLCVFLALAACFYTADIFLFKSLFFLRQLAENHVSFGFSRISYYALLALVFTWGALTSFFGKNAILASLFLYGIISCLSLAALRQRFGPQDRRVTLKVDETSISAGGKIARKSPEKYQSVVIDLRSLPDSVFLPIPRKWLAVRSVAERENPLAGTKILSADSEPPDNEIPFRPQDDEPGGLMNKIISFYTDKVLLRNDAVSCEVPLPGERIYPSLLTVKVDFGPGTMSAEIIRDL